MKEIKKKDINFVTALGQMERSGGDGRKNRVWLAIPIALLAGGLLIFIVLQGLNWRSEAILADYAGEMEALAAAEDYRAVLMLDVVLEATETAHRNALAAREAMAAFPALSESFFTRLESCLTEKVTVSGYSYIAEDGSFVIQGTAIGITETAAFVRRLRDAALFSSLSYTGYSEEMQEEAAALPPATRLQLEALESNANAAAAKAAENPADSAAQLSAQIAAQRLAEAKTAAEEERKAAAVTLSGSGQYRFVITGHLERKGGGGDGD